MITIVDIQSRLDTFPRVKLGHYPTPLELLPRLSAKLNSQIYVKRDDVIGPGMGGNKTRKLEYLLGDALRLGKRKVVTFGGLQSNHARLTAAACRKVGLEPHLFFFEPCPPRLEGNLLLNHLLGAKMHFIPFGGGGGMSLESTNRLVHMIALMTVGPHYFIPLGGHSWIGCLGYVQAALEIDQQAKDAGIQNACLFLAAGSGGTLAGLMAGLALVDSSIKIMGIDVTKMFKGFRASVARMAEELCRRLGVERHFHSEQVPVIESRYVGEKYGRPSLPGLATIRCLARLEGLVLDPVYTGKACAGMIDLFEKGQINREQAAIFLHTGGTPALFAFGSELITNHSNG